MFQKIKEWLTNQQYPTAAQKNATAKVAPPLFMQRSPVAQDKVIRQRLRECEQELQRSEIERERMYHQHLGAYKLYREKCKQNYTKCQVIIFLALCMIFFLLFIAITPKKLNQVVEDGELERIELVSNGKEILPDDAIDYDCWLFVNHDNGLLKLKRFEDYQLDLFVLKDSLYTGYDTNLYLDLPKGIDADAKYLTRVLLSTDEDEYESVAEFALASNKDLRIQDISLMSSMHLVGDDAISQYLAGVEAKSIKTSYASEMWHFQIEFYTTIPKYQTTFMTTGRFGKVILLALLAVVIISAIIIPSVAKLSLAHISAGDDNDEDEEWYDDLEDEEEFVARLKDYLQDYEKRQKKS